MRLNRTSLAQLKVGDLVTTDYDSEHRKLIRRIIGIIKDDSCGSGFRIMADGGEICPHCGRQEKSTPPVDGAWFVPVDWIEKFLND